MTVPFTYLIKFIPTGQFYYGVRWANGCHPDDLWQTYFTSSTYVKDLIKENGKDAFEVQVRKTFDDHLTAQNWERRVLKRMNVVKREDCLNQHDGTIFYTHRKCWVKKGSDSRFVSEKDVDGYLADGWVRGRYFSEEHKQKNRLGCARRLETGSSAFKGKQHTSEVKSKISAQRKGKPSYTKPITYLGVTYPSITEAVATTGISSYRLHRLVSGKTTSP